MTSEPATQPLAKFVKTFGEQGPTHGDFDAPIGIAIKVYVADQTNRRVQVFGTWQPNQLCAVHL